MQGLLGSRSVSGSARASYSPPAETEWEWDLFRLAEGLEVDWTNPRSEGEGLSQLTSYNLRVYLLSSQATLSYGNLSGLAGSGSGGSASSISYPDLRGRMSVSASSFPGGGSGSKSSEAGASKGPHTNAADSPVRPKKGQHQELAEGAASSSSTLAPGHLMIEESEGLDFREHIVPGRASSSTTSSGSVDEADADAVPDNLGQLMSPSTLEAYRQSGAPPTAQSTSSAGAVAGAVSVSPEDGRGAGRSNENSTRRPSSGPGRASTQTAANPSSHKPAPPPPPEVGASSSSSRPFSVSGSVSFARLPYRRKIAEVRRFYHDLVWLWEQLSSRNPHWIMPALPGKSLVSTFTDERKLLARAQWYTDAMNQLCADHFAPQLRSSRLFFEFLAVPSIAVVQRKFQFKMKLRPPPAAPTRAPGTNAGVGSGKRAVASTTNDDLNVTSEDSGGANAALDELDNLHLLVSAGRPDDGKNGRNDDAENSTKGSVEPRSTSPPLDSASQADGAVENPLSTASRNNDLGRLLREHHSKSLVPFNKLQSSFKSAFTKFHSFVQDVSQTATSSAHQRNTAAGHYVDSATRIWYEESVQSRFAIETQYLADLLKKVQRMLAHMRVAYSRLLEWREAVSEFAVLGETRAPVSQVVLAGSGRYLREAEVQVLYPLERLSRSILNAQEVLRRRSSRVDVVLEGSTVLELKKRKRLEAIQAAQETANAAGGAVGVRPGSSRSAGGFFSSLRGKTKPKLDDGTQTPTVSANSTGASGGSEVSSASRASSHHLQPAGVDVTSSSNAQIDAALSSSQRTTGAATADGDGEATSSSSEDEEKVRAGPGSGGASSSSLQPRHSGVQTGHQSNKDKNDEAEKEILAWTRAIEVSKQEIAVFDDLLEQEMATFQSWAQATLQPAVANFEKSVLALGKAIASAGNSAGGASF